MESNQIKADACYAHAEKRAAEYFKELYIQASQKAFVPALTADFEEWKKEHVKRRTPRRMLETWLKPGTTDYRKYIQWLESTGKIDSYLDRSVSYIYMRDLGKALGAPETQESVRKAVVDMRKQLTKSRPKEEQDSISMTKLYKEARKEGIEGTMIWVVEKLKSVTTSIPEGMDAEEAQRKLIKLIGGVLMHEVEEMPDDLPKQQRTTRLDQAIRLGYCYGLTYPFIDDLLDARILSEEETKRYSDLIRTTLVTRAVPDLGEWSGKNGEFIGFVHRELREAFEYIKTHQRSETMDTFFEQAYVFFNSQELDRDKLLSVKGYTNEEIYIPVILKSSSSRLIARSVISADEDEGFDNRTFYYGIYNQLADDFADMFDDAEDNAVTPYTYFMKYHKEQPELVNPFALYWTVIANLIHNVYESDPRTREVILDRAINGLKRYKQRMGEQKYQEIMGELEIGDRGFSELVQDMVCRADDVDFLDKLLRDHMVRMFKDDKKERDVFKDKLESVRDRLNTMLDIPKPGETQLVPEPIVSAANYSLAGDGKRLRPIVAWEMGVNVYGLTEEAILPLMRSLEYLHTASLIFDDLPAQDNAPMRRGRKTLHKTHDTAVAELTGLFLTQRAVEEQAQLAQFDGDTVLELIRYSAQKIQEMCRGQAMDLGAKGKKLTLEQLNDICFYKTGIAFEASLLMPAILAHAGSAEREALKLFAHHAGIAFQIKDDLLDAEGNEELLGKPTGMDTANRTATFVTVLGTDGARREMWEHYCSASDALKQISRNMSFLKHLLDYIVHRDK